MMDGMDEDDDYALIISQHEVGSLDRRPRRALENRANFFEGVGYLLYLWEMLEKYDLRRSCLQVIDKNVAAGDGGSGVPSLFDGLNGNQELGDGGSEYYDDVSSLGSKQKSARKSDGKEIEQIAHQMKTFNQRILQLRLFEKEQKEKDRQHATNERIMAETHTKKRGFFLTLKVLRERSVPMNGSLFFIIRSGKYLMKKMVLPLLCKPLLRLLNKASQQNVRN